MLFTPDPLTERLVLLWHNHFATSNDKVQNAAAMRQQNDEFRELAKARFSRLLHRAMRSPALLVWLDAPANRRDHPNENLAREVMELFTLGIGNYTETDVREAARALTGWTVVENRFQVNETHHDAGEKTVLGRRGRLTGDDLLNLLLEQPATAERLANRLCELFFADNAVTREDRRALAAGLRRNQLDIGWAVETILRSQAFFANSNLGRMIASPVEYMISAARALEMADPAPSTGVLADWAARLGQDLFHPFTVFGWPGGRAWITPRTMSLRTAFAFALVDGQDIGRASPLDPSALAGRHGRNKNLESVLGFYVELLLGQPMTAAWFTRLTAGVGQRVAAEPANVRRAVATILAAPEGQFM